MRRGSETSSLLITSCLGARLESQTSNKGVEPQVSSSTADWQEKERNRQVTSCVLPAWRASHLAAGASRCTDSRQAHTAGVESLPQTHQRLSAHPMHGFLQEEKKAELTVKLASFFS